MALRADMARASAADLAACRALLRTGSRTFFAASFLLPAAVRTPATALYAFCRLADDAVDVEAAGGAIVSLRERLDRAYAGRPINHAADRAFADAVARASMPRALPEALLEGFAWDAEERRYETIEDLTAYGARVAGAVGAMMAVLMERRAPETIARAADLGVAMQFTNIARDVGEDARAGRLYLPFNWLRAADIDPEQFLARPRFTPALGSVVKRLLDEAGALYARADAGIADLPSSCRPGIAAARLLYAEIGHAVERQGLDSVSHRAVVPAMRKAALLARALATQTRIGPGREVPQLDATRFLVDAAGVPGWRPRLPTVTPDGVAWWQVGQRLVRVLDLFEALERRSQRRNAS